MQITDDELQQIIDDLDWAKCFVPDDLEASLQTASDLLVAHQTIITGKSE